MNLQSLGFSWYAEVGGDLVTNSEREMKMIESGIFKDFFMYFIQHCFICRLSESTVSEDAGIKPRTVATLAFLVRRSNHAQLDLIHTQLDLIHNYRK
jgi:hypothetical protein